jgi:hypothetical protein
MCFAGGSGSGCGGDFDSGSGCDLGEEDLDLDDVFLLGIM